MSARILATVVTGFLGAGKTSLLRHLIDDAGGRRLALVINEFGDLGVDREILDGCGLAACRPEDVVELANGCICCTVADDFLPTIQKLIDRPDPPDHIVIETSGLALPKPLVKAFAWPEVRARTSVDGVVTVVDAAAVAAGRFVDDPARVARQRAANPARKIESRAADPSPDHDNPLEEVFEDQLACADLVIVNKTDLVDKARLETLMGDIRRRLRAGVKLVPARHGALPAAVVLGLAAAAEDDLAQRPSHHDAEGGAHDHDDFDSFAVKLPPVADPLALIERLKSVAGRHDVLRVKGFLDVPGKPRRQVVQGVGQRIQLYFDRPWRADETRQGALVVIGLKGLDRGAIEAELRAN